MKAGDCKESSQEVMAKRVFKSADLFVPDKVPFSTDTPALFWFAPGKPKQ